MTVNDIVLSLSVTAFPADDAEISCVAKLNKKYFGISFLNSLLLAICANSVTLANPVTPPNVMSDANDQKLHSPGTSEENRSPVSLSKNGEINGKIYDENNLPLANARIVLVKKGEEHKRKEVETDKAGLFHFLEVEPGEWIITSSAASMHSDTQALVVKSHEKKSIDIALQSIEPVDLMRITGKQTLIHPEKIGSTTNINHDTIYQYKSGDDLNQLVQSTPGIITDSLGLSIIRGEHGAANYNLDGVFLPEAAGVLQQSNFINPRSLQSMQVDIGGYGASDGGGPLAAIVRLKSLPITSKPSFTFGQQMGGPMAGNFYYNASGAFSQDPSKILNRLRYESSGSFRGTSLGVAPPTASFAHNGRADINFLGKLEFLATERDTIKLTTSVNNTYFEVPTSKASYQAGVRQNQQDQQSYAILSWKHRYAKWFDESNLHLLTSFYNEKYRSNNVFDPNPVINGGQPLQSIAPNANRFNFVLGSQGSLTKTIKTHKFETGYLTESRWVKTDFGATYYNNDPNSGVPIGAVISPFTGQPVGPGNPSFTRRMGKLNGYRLLQSAYLQDTIRPEKGWLKRLTLVAGVRADLVHNVFGNTKAVEQAIETIPGSQPFLSSPFNTQRATAAQASGRYGLSYVIDPKTVYRISYSNLFTPLPVDAFSTPPTVTSDNLVNGVYNGTVRKQAATRGQLADTSIEHQVGSRFAIRQNIFWKTLSNYGDSNVVGNSLLYSRQSVSGQVTYGAETRIDLKKARDGFGFNGFLSNTLALALLTGSKQVTGGIYNIQTTPILDKYPDHDRREAVQAAFGWQSRNNWWWQANYSFLSGLQDERDPALVGNHPNRSPWINTLGLNAGYKVPKELKQKCSYLPDNIDARFENLTNNRLPTNLGSPYQGTRYLLPFRFLIGCSWQLGQQEYRLVQKPTPGSSSVITQ